MSGNRVVGFIGLGNMGGALAANLVRDGFEVMAYDAAGPARTPDGARWAPNPTDVARAVATVVLSLPDGTACGNVMGELLAARDRRVTHVVDTSTVGVAAARHLAATGLSYVDAPVSGGVAGARKRTLMVMYSGSDDDCARVEPVLAGLSDRRRRVGVRPGQAQALKLANNFLSASALAAASEAVAFARAAGVDMAVLLEVLNASSGRSGATIDKFPQEVLTGRYASGFSNSLMAKDLRLYLHEVDETDGPAALGAITEAVWEAFATAEPGVDFTRIYPFVSGS
ncbi:NAD(P)-dependent oxidoreductase [Streptomyces fuscichromogenes]|uniref:2-hydroxy-3-oxopropionate reductase n=1 Tax=Streptomyces fuscichromogenes TaxID=1324013 RepID=A0A917XLW1_9ACTN|nr:NAD(P)-dependent oxidoreductase [Streptomyces fuscichromogenes]GGN36750.1 2-hydroxy-3-oxopropionate reductase [Streptomyces fuscichromogenes]